jgi:hypothetical protein
MMSDPRRDLDERPSDLVAANDVAKRLRVAPAWVLADACRPERS